MSSIFGKPSSQSSSGTSNSQSNSQSVQGSQSQNSSYSGNQFADMLAGGLGGQMANAGQASNGLAALLGIGGDPAQQAAAFKNFQNSTGYQAQLQAGNQAITGGAASKGLLNSGSTAKALVGFGQNLADKSYQSYMNGLQGLVGSGNQAAGIISGAGNESASQGTSNSYGQSLSNSTSTSQNQSSGKGEKKGLGGFIGGLL